MLYYNLMHLRRTTYAIVYMQVIETVRKVGYIQLHRSAATFTGLQQHDAKPIVEPHVVG